MNAAIQRSRKLLVIITTVVVLETNAADVMEDGAVDCLAASGGISSSHAGDSPRK